MKQLSDYNKLWHLFAECLSARYRRVENGADFAIRRVNNDVTIFFEHSDGALDWKNNFSFASRPYRDMGEGWRCHRGFLSVFRAAEPYLAPVITDETVKKITVVGYSHGAALALLCHEYIWFHRPDLRDSLEGYGFGCPRVFYGRMTPTLQARWERFFIIRNIDDIVTHLPPRLFGYRHVKAPLLIGERGRYSQVDAHRAESYLQELRLLADRVTDEKGGNAGDRRRDRHFADKT